MGVATIALVIIVVMMLGKAYLNIVTAEDDDSIVREYYQARVN